MTDPQPQSSPVTLTPEPIPPAADTLLPLGAPTPQPTGRNWFPLFLVLAALGIATCVCVGLCIATMGSSLYAGITERDDIEQVLDRLMTAMEAKDSQTAYALFSVRAQRQWGIEELDKLLVHGNYVIFKNYRSLSLQNINISAAVNTNPDAPQGTVANVSAIIEYDDGFEGQMTAVLEKDGKEWRLFGFNVIVPPDKLTQDDAAFN